MNTEVEKTITIAKKGMSNVAEFITVPAEANRRWILYQGLCDGFVIGNLSKLPLQRGYVDQFDIAFICIPLVISRLASRFMFHQTKHEKPSSP